MGVVLKDPQGNLNDDPNWALSMAAAIPSGVIKILEGGATFGAALLDLGADQDRVEAVEEYFDKINPFDEVAASTGIGKITELIVNIGVPPGTPMLTINSVILPIPVEAATSSNGFILSKYSSTASTLS